MLGTLLAHALMSGQPLCPRCQSRLVAVGLRYCSQTHYETLGIERSASQAEVRSAFLSLSKKLHPDINKKDPKTHEKFVKLNEAYNVLKKPIARREYDLNLAVRLQMEQQARYASQSHVYGSSAWPGSGTSSDRQFDADQQQFWDETIWHMRDKSKDKDFEGKPYYGFTNMKRLSNMDILMGCFAIMAVGAILHYYALRKSSQMHKALLDEKDKEYFSNLSKARSNAKLHGNALQLQILKSKVMKTPLEGVSEDVMRDAFTEGRKAR